MKNTPNKIYLQIDADGETPEDFEDLKGVSWCNERVHENDLEYVLKQNLPGALEIQAHAKVLDEEQFRVYFNEIIESLNTKDK